MKKLSSIYALILFGLTACGGGGDGDSSNGLTGLSECIAPNAEQAVVCGTVLANDGVTPLVNAEITLATSARAAARGVANDDKCLSDAAGDYVCLLPEGVTGTVKLTVSSNGFDDSSITTQVSEGQVTEAGNQTLVGNTSEKWVVVPGAFDGVQVLLAQLKGCILTNPDGSAYTTNTPPQLARGSADCETKGLTVLENDSDAIEGYLASNELLNNDSLFINCAADNSTPEIDSLMNTFVDQGNHVYFSDLSDSWLTKAFPNKINFAGDNTQTGTLNASVNSSGLASVIGGNTMNIEFDLPVWTAIDSVANDVTTFIEGDISDISGYSGTRPITVGWKESANSGCVFYTSYHIEGAETQGAPQELAIKYLVQNISSVCQ